MSSKIQASLAKATEVTPKKDESIVDQTYMKRLAIAVGELGDADWDKLPGEGQDWTNEASDATNTKKDIPIFKDYVKPEEPTGRRRRAAAEDADTPALYAPKKGDVVEVTTKRGKVVEGTVVDPDEKGMLILDDGKEELELPLEGLTIEPAAAAEEPTGRRRRAAAEEPEGPAEPEVSDTVEIKTKRGKVAVGNIVEIDAKTVVIKNAAGDEEEFVLDRIDSILVKVKNAGKGQAGKPDKTPDKGDPAKNTKTSKEDNGGVSVTTRARELMCDDLAASKEDIMKLLKKEGLEFKENTIQLIFGDVQKLVKMLRERKLMK